jgi:hypothetical protein
LSFTADKLRITRCQFQGPDCLAGQSLYDARRTAKETDAIP